jgi:hypothetical protein
MKDHGAEVLEAYPVDPRKRHSSNLLWNGALDVFPSIAFTKECKRGSERWIFKKTL